MATYSANVTESYSFFPDNLSGSQATVFAVTNSLSNVSYFSLETVPNSSGFYSGSTPSISGSFSYSSGIINLVKDDYKMAAVVAPGGGSITFTPAVPVTGSQLYVRGTGYKDVTNQALATVQTFQAAVLAAGGEVSGNEYTALLTLTQDLISYNLLPKMKTIYPVVSSQRNLESYTQDFTNAFWDKVGGGVTATASFTTAPDGTLTGNKITEVGGGGVVVHHIHDQTGAYVPVVGQKYTMSTFIKRPPTNADQYAQLAFWVAGFGSNAYVNFDIENVRVGGIGSSITEYGIQDAGNGWYRLWVSATATATGSSGWQVCFVSSLSASRAEPYSVPLGQEESFYIWGAQVEKGGLTAYNPTLSTPDAGFAAAYKMNLVNPAQFSGSFSSGWTFSSTGMTPNGTSAYMDTFLTPSVSLSANNISLTYYSRTDSAYLTSTSIGADSSSPNEYCRLIIRRAADASYVLIGNTTIGLNQYVVTDSRGLFIANAPNSTTRKLFKNNSTVTPGSQSGLGTNGLSTRTIYVGALHDTTAAEYDNKECAFSSIGDGLTDTDAFYFYQAVQRYQTLLNRQV